MSASEKLEKQHSWGAELMIYDGDTATETDIMPQVLALVKSLDILFSGDTEDMQVVAQREQNVVDALKDLEEVLPS